MMEDDSLRSETEVMDIRLFPTVKVVWVNLVILAVYTLVCRWTNNVDLLILEIILVTMQTVICVIVATAQKSIFWLFSALLVAVIGFSTWIGIKNEPTRRYMNFYGCRTINIFYRDDKREYLEQLRTEMNI